MIPNFLHAIKTVTTRLPWRARRQSAPHDPLAHPVPLTLPLAALPPAIAACPVACQYHALLSVLDWSQFPERDPARPWPGPTPERRAPYAAALLVKLHEHHPSMGHLRRFLVQHPALVWLLGFPRVVDPAAPLGFDVAATVPSRSRCCRVLRVLPNPTLQWVLTASVAAVHAALPPEHVATFAHTIAGDTKHILAWVKENNPKQFIAEGRLDKTRQPAGDPDCKLGVKKRRNAAPRAEPPTPTTEAQPTTTLQIGSDILWGYASGVVVTTVPDCGTVVLAERTRPFNESDISYFTPLMAQVEERLGRKPRNGAWDTAYDARYVYDYFDAAGGMAAVPLNPGKRGGTRQFDPTGLPLCAAGLAMPLKLAFWDQTVSLIAHERGKYGCPLLLPEPTGVACPIADPHWEKGGCVTTMATSRGARIRLQLDRTSPAYRAMYAQRSAVERINSQATALGIERPKLRNGAAIANQNTLLYALLNLRLRQRMQSRQSTLTA